MINTIEIRRGDERLTKGRVGPNEKFCLVHGYMRLTKVLDAGEIYEVCRWCVENSPLIATDYAEVIPG